MNAQNGTIRVQRNPGQWDSSLHCGGVLQRARFMLELSLFQPVMNEVFYNDLLPGNFLIRNGAGAHVCLDLPGFTMHYRNFGLKGPGFAKLYLLSGFDMFRGLSQPDSGIDYRAFMRVPLLLNLKGTLISKPGFILFVETSVGAALLTHRSRGPSSPTILNRFIPGYTVGFNFMFRAARRHMQGFSFKISYLEPQWFGEASIIFPICYGRFKRNIANTN